MRNEDNRSAYCNVLRFIKNELHIKLTFYQTQVLKYILDGDVQKRLQEMYKDNQ